MIRNEVSVILPDLYRYQDEKENVLLFYFEMQGKNLQYRC